MLDAVQFSRLMEAGFSSSPVMKHSSSPRLQLVAFAAAAFAVALSAFAQTSRLDVVTIQATVPDAFPSNQPGVFTIARQGDTNYALAVFYHVGGTASNGVDYAQIPSGLAIPAGSLTADILIQPKTNSLSTTDKTVELKLAPSLLMCPSPPCGYYIGSPSNATVVIHFSATTNGPGATLYRLNPNTAYELGCFPPCLCPDTIMQPVRGTFLLKPTGFDGLFKAFTVTNVHWSFTNNGAATSVTGSGTYKIGGSNAPQQQLSLALQLNGGPVEHFDSGLVTDSTPFPNINVTISTNRQICFDTVFKVSASPTPVPQLLIAVTQTNTVLLSWAVSSDPFDLQATSGLATTDWTTVTNPPVVIGQQNQVTLPLSAGNQCYRPQPGGN
jgi:hypothetical protein